MLQSAPCIEEKTGSEHQRGYDDIADTSCKEQPEAVNRSQNGNQPYFERDVVLPQPLIVNCDFQAVQGGQHKRNHDSTGCQGIHGLISG